MEFLRTLIDHGLIVMACPSCGRNNWSESGLSGGRLQCNHCFTHPHHLLWISKISLRGDDDPFINLSLTRKDGGFLIQVDLSKRSSHQSEYVRYCAIGGYPAFHTMNCLMHSLTLDGKVDQKEICFTGLGGLLKIFLKRGMPDLWVSTEDLALEEPYGVLIGFDAGDKAVQFLEKLLAAMLLDLQSSYLRSRHK